MSEPINMKICIAERDDGFHVESVFEDGSLFDSCGPFDTFAEAKLCADDLVELTVQAGGKILPIESKTRH